MQSTKVLALLISIVSFQSLQATSSSTSQESPIIIKLDSISKKDPEGFWGQLKQTISSWMPSFKVSSSHPRESVKHTENTKWWAISEEGDQPWAQEWSQLVGHVAEENAKQIKSVLTQMKYRKGEYLLGHQKGMSYYEGVAKEVKKKP